VPILQILFLFPVNGKIRVKTVLLLRKLSPTSGHLRLDHCPEFKVNSDSFSLPFFLFCVCSDMAVSNLCQGHVVGGGESSPAGGGVCGSDHTGQRTPAVAPTGRYRLLCVCMCVCLRVD